MSNRYLVWLEWPEQSFRIDAKALGVLRSLVPAGSTVIRARTEKAFLRELPKATHAIVWNFKSEWYALAPKLKLLATPGAGRELVSQAAPAGVKVHFGAFHGAIMAESVAGFILAWSRGFFLRPPKSAAAWPRVWMSDKCRTVAGTRAVIAGYGHIGRAIGAKLEALGVSVSGFGRKNLADLPRAAKTADWFVMALPGDTGTDDFLNAKLIARLPRHCVVVNVGRGNAVDETALLKALRTGRIAGAYLDVFKREPHPFRDRLPNLVKMPHASAFAPDYVIRCFKELKDEHLI